MKCLTANGRSTKLVGRSLDLASAYRQLAISDGSLPLSYLGQCLTLWSPERPCFNRLPCRSVQGLQSMPSFAVLVSCSG